MNYNKVIVIGAPRSGTNMLRDMLVLVPGIGTWSCDEINYIWRHGNIKFHSDEFLPDMATPKIQNYIRKEFDKIANNYKLDTLIEKTCANSLRVGFVDKIVPDCKYIFIVRDGVDAVGSALERWRANLDIPYLIRKARYVPFLDMPYYALRYLSNRIHRLTSSDSRLAFWGPAMSNIDDLLACYSLEEVCALQWKACVDYAERDFEIIPSNRILKVKYEEFVTQPDAEFHRIANYLEVDVPQNVTTILAKDVRATSIGKGRQALGEEKINSLRPLIADTLDKYGYE